jgi:hypothetical protein
MQFFTDHSPEKLGAASLSEMSRGRSSMTVGENQSYGKLSMGEIKIGNTAKLLTTEVTAEQKAILKKLCAPQLPAVFL